MSETVGLFKKFEGSPEERIFHVKNGHGTLCGADGDFYEFRVEKDRPCPDCVDELDEVGLYRIDRRGRIDSNSEQHIPDNSVPLCRTSNRGDNRTDPGKYVRGPTWLADPCMDCKLASGEEVEGKVFDSASLTANGSGSLIMTVPQKFWKHAGIVHDDPGSVSIVYDMERKVAKLDFRQIEDLMEDI